MKSKRSLRVVILDDTAERADELMNWLRRAEYGVRARFAPDSDELLRLCQKYPWDMVLLAGSQWSACLANCAMMLEGVGRDALMLVVDHPKQSVSAEIMDSALRLGAVDVVPRRENRLIHAINRDMRGVHTFRRYRTQKLALHAASKRCDKLILQSPKAIACVTPGGHVLANESYCRLFGYASLEDLKTVSFESLLPAGEREKYQGVLEQIDMSGFTPVSIKLQTLHADQSSFDSKLHITPAVHNRVNCLQIVVTPEQSIDASLTMNLVREAAQARAAAHTLESMSWDEQEYLTTQIESGLARAGQGKESVYLHVEITDRDQLKTSLGAAVNNLMAALKELVDRQQMKDQHCAILEYPALGLLLRDTDVDAAKQYAARLHKTVNDHVFKIAARMLRISIHIGIVVISPNLSTHMEVLEHGKDACHQACQHALTTALYGEQSTRSVDMLARAELNQYLQKAIAEKRFELHYQPILSLREDVVDIYEVLLHVVDEHNEEVSADTIFAAARLNNLTELLDQWVVNQAVSVIANLAKEMRQCLFIKVENESIKNTALLVGLSKLLQEHKLAANRLIFEISENILSAAPKFADAFMSSLRRLGCGVAVEHVGISLKAIDMLEKLNVDYVKIDAALITQMASDNEATALVNNIVGIARERGIKTIAESVNHSGVLMAVVSAGIDFAQGGFIQAPGNKMDFNFSAR